MHQSLRRCCIWGPSRLLLISNSVHGRSTMWVTLSMKEPTEAIASSRSGQCWTTLRCCGMQNLPMTMEPQASPGSMRWIPNNWGHCFSGTDSSDWTYNLHPWLPGRQSVVAWQKYEACVYEWNSGLPFVPQELVCCLRATSHTSQEPWPWKCESPKKSVQRLSQDTSNIM